MKELRCKTSNHEWRILFAFDPDRKTILPAAGSKTGVNQKRFYKQLIAKADGRYKQHLALCKGEEDDGQVPE